MKRLILIVMLMMLPSMLFALDDSETLLVKAYKVSHSTEPFLNLTVIDSITDGTQLNNVISNQTQVDIGEFVNSTGTIIGTLPANNTKLGDVAYGNTLFSYRAEGNIEGRFSVTISIGRFAGKEHPDSFIDGYYELSSKSVGYNGVSSSLDAEVSDDGTNISSTYDGCTISYTQQEMFGQTSDDKDTVVLTTRWSVDNGNNTFYEYTGATWLTREAVFGVISQEDYNSSPNDTYTARVTVRLEVS